MKFHKEGNVSILLASITTLILFVLAKFMFAETLWLKNLLMLIGLFILVVILQFFRKPNRELTPTEGLVYAPADGKVVVIEQTFENEFLNKECIQVSIFMSPVNVHINWYPISGIIKYFKYHPGKFLVAWHPKASTDNERTTVVVENKKGAQVLLRQIAGALARRIVCYAQNNNEVNQGQEMGFIKFGSRVDIFLPLGTNIKVNLDEKVTGNRTVIAELV